ncbi:hypothetical protein FAES_0126 [Fibrella aestuarina BUZ 2]|uniref:Uncharacterized protein n=1 Tax=Fibrella aestuarina BUZ 2 TaxID=1166018 RepID=I0K1Y7_9BACT|nr:hypothetical protein [Fibrella aestuarina]CCG98140.1 hypothetical protein FAES_0126 [Fibrella aestuarina BUZ 2]
MSRRPASFQFLLFFVLIAASVSAQVRSGGKTYTYLIYHKLAPGMTIQNAMPVEREWKAINQAAVDEGKLIGWHMMVKQFSSNPNPAEYDYVTCIVSPTMGMGGASPAAMAKLYGDSVQVRMADLNRRDRLTAPVVRIDIWENLDALYGPDFSPGKTQTVVVDFLKLRDPLADWPGTLASLKQTGSTLIDQKQAGGWSFSALKVPAGSEKGYGFALTRPVTSLNVLADPTDPKLAAAQKQLNRLFEVVRQEVYRFELFTTRPAAK